MQPHPAAQASDNTPRKIRGSDYDRYYRTLELRPGATLQEIEDRARLLRDAFHPDDAPPQLRAQARERAAAVDEAAQALRRYWRDHAEAPPSADLSEAEGLLDALVEALAGSSAPRQKEEGPAAAPRAEPRAVFIPPRTAPREERPSAQSPSDHYDALFRQRPTADPRVQRIEIALEIVQRHVVVLPPQMQQAIGRATPSLPPSARVAPAAPPPAVIANAAGPRQRGSLAVKLGVAGLAIALALLAQHYGQELALPGGPSSPAYAAAETTAPPPPAPEQPGLRTAAPRPTGVFAQPPSRDLYFGSTSTFIRR